jgi:hypothetical protein
MHVSYMASFSYKNGTVASILLDGYNDGLDYGDIVFVTGSGGVLSPISLAL